ncbi:helix-turn-helix domain-containing protein [Jannaschia sp. Os4]|uniref:helix-turn-helix domain-containing protein n=1 Tax=Jannaschia sp. Os4 TaxID=2807617 RepID=UPI00193AB7A7|nr:helix-turn-helix domain-containing protein [Jannaschia sp. Os4]MBM2578106.1 helix-turn-helix domain-containing protein [Jannaschia sp. Os4]
MTALRAQPFAPAPASRPLPPVRPVRSLAPRAALFREGDRASHVFEVVSGTLRQTRLLECGRRQVVAFAHPGDMVGFPADGAHHADCEALTAVTVIAHPRAALDGAGGEPDLHRRLHGAALREIARLQDHLLLLARKGAVGKLASFLGDLADRHGAPCADGTALDLEMPRTDIADYLCLTIETVSRTLTRMCDEGVLRREGTSRLVVTDRDGLGDMARGE